MKETDNLKQEKIFSKLKNNSKLKHEILILKIVIFLYIYVLF